MAEHGQQRLAHRGVLVLGATLALAGCATGSPPPASPVATPRTELVLAAFGDSITAEMAEVCPGCTPWVDRYTEALNTATGTPVSVRNRGQPSLRVEALLETLTDGSNAADAAAADAIVVGVGNSDAPWNITDDACDGPATAVEMVPWDAYSDDCIAAEVERFRPTFDALFKRLAELRDGQPTILRAINRYNDWIGFEGGEVPPEAVEISMAYNDSWNAMICETAEANGFACADIGRAFNGEDGRTASGELLASDYLHPSDKGHERIAEVLVGLGFAPLADP
jgi:lysophospholipase L1-like esterase